MQAWLIHLSQVNNDKSINLLAALRGLVAQGFIEVHMVILIHLADPHSHAVSATPLSLCMNA